MYHKEVHHTTPPPRYGYGSLAHVYQNMDSQPPPTPGAGPSKGGQSSKAWGSKQVIRSHQGSSGYGPPRFLYHSRSQVLVTEGDLVEGVDTDDESDGSEAEVSE
jgi:hypothetical protein